MMPGDLGITSDWITFLLDPGYELARSAIPTYFRQPGELVLLAASRKRELAYNKPMMHAVFLDRDGVLIENRSDYVRDWSHVTILPQVVDSLSGFYKAGFKIVIVTNQSAVGRGLMTFETAQAINDRLALTIKESGGWVDAVYMCPHTPKDQCSCRKPLPGLLLQAAREMSLDLRSSWMVGDAWSDLLAGQAAGLQGTILVKTGRGSSQLLETQPVEIRPFFIADDLYRAFCYITDFLQKNGSSVPDS